MYVDHPRDGSKLTFLIHASGHSSDEYNVLNDFGPKYAKESPLNEIMKDPVSSKKLGQKK